MRTKIRSTVLFVLIVFIIGIIGFIGIKGSSDFLGTGYAVKSFGKMINRGLDLSGGISILEELDVTDNISTKELQEDVSKTIQLMTYRLNPNGVSEIVITQEGSKRIRIDVPGKYNLDETIATVGKTGTLKFLDPDGNTLLTGKDVKKATARFNSSTSEYEVDLEFNSTGTKAFADATTKFLGKTIKITMDDVELTSPTVQSVISNGQASISSRTMTLTEAQKYANIINSGALPVSVKVVSSQIVGATLGAEAFQQSKIAGMIGVAIVFLFMILYYRVPGFLATISLVVYMLLVLATLALVDATLTLSGIAGFILTVGVACDANILIFERMKEELKTGKSTKGAIDAGFHRALSSIIDSNFITIIAGFILYSLGTGSVKGFALTLIIGVIISMLVAIIFTRFMINLAYKMGWFNQKWSIGTFGVHEIRRGTK